MFYFTASKEAEDLIVREMRNFFIDVSAYGAVFSKDYSILGNPFNRNNENQPQFLISAGFPERFRYYPNILVKCSVQQFHKVGIDNLIAQQDIINQYGKRVPDSFIKGGHVTININTTIRSLDQSECEELADLVAFWSADYGYESLKLKSAFIEPFGYPSGVAAENIKDTTDQKKLYRINMGTSMRLSWLVPKTIEGLTISKVTVQQLDSNIDNV